MGHSQGIIEKRPKFLLGENVRGLIEPKNIAQFKKWLLELESYGYKNFVKVLDSQNYGIAQHRPRVFTVSLLGGGDFEFPKSIELTKCMRDYLEDNVEEKYYLSDRTVNSLAEHCERKQREGCGFKFQPTEGGGIAKTINCLAGSRHTDNFIMERRVIQIGNLYPDQEGFKNRTAGRVYSDEGCSPTIRTPSGGSNIPQIAVEERVRKLTPRECLRLMDVDDCLIDRLLMSGLSDTQLIKLAGNSIVVDVLYHIFRKMFVETENKNQQLTLF